MQQGLRCQEPFPGQGPDQNKIRSIYLIPDCSKPISAVIYPASGSLVRHWFLFCAGSLALLGPGAPAHMRLIKLYRDQQRHKNIYNKANYPVMFSPGRGQD